MSALKRSMAVVALSLAVTLPVKADIVLDTFEYFDLSTGGITEEFYLSGITGTTASDLIAFDSGARVSYELLGAGVINPNVTVGGGELAYAAGPGDLSSTLNVTYTSSDTNFNSYGDSFYVDIEKLNAGNEGEGFSFYVKFTDSRGGYATFGDSFTSDINIPTMLTYRFNKFDKFDGFDFTDVNGATISYNSAGFGSDFELNEIGIVPEPATLGVLGLGLMGLGLRRRKFAK